MGEAAQRSCGGFFVDPSASGRCRASLEARPVHRIATDPREFEGQLAPRHQTLKPSSVWPPRQRYRRLNGQPPGGEPEGRGRWRGEGERGMIAAMPRVAFTANLQRHLPCPPERVSGETVQAVLESVFRANPRLRSYLLDDQGRLRRHVVVYVNDRPVADRARLSDAVAESDEVFVFQALSGG